MRTEDMIGKYLELAVKEALKKYALAQRKQPVIIARPKSSQK